VNAVRDGANRAAGASISGSGREAAILARSDRLQALLSAWQVLAPSGLADGKEEIAEIGRELGEGIGALFAGEPAEGDGTALEDVDGGCDAIEHEMREAALQITVGQLRATIPPQLEGDRPGVLNLLDLLVGTDGPREAAAPPRLPVLEYLICLLCTGGDPDGRLQDPSTLTPRLQALCQAAEAAMDPRHAGVEAEFFVAADVFSAGACDEAELRTVSQRKASLGPDFFAPNILRGIMTYNAAALRHVDPEAMVAGGGDGAPAEQADLETASVFEHSATPQLLAALRRRAAGESPSHDPYDRVAWCLALEDLNRLDEARLLADDTGTPENPTGTTIFVSLICRAALVLDDELSSVGIPPDLPTGTWVPELESALQQEANRCIANEDYPGACKVSEFKSRFLSSAREDARRAGNRRVVRSDGAAEEEERETRKEAERLTGAALESSGVRGKGVAWREIPWGKLAAGCVTTALSAVALLQINAIYLDGSRISGEDLKKASVFLTAGKRSAEGTGTAFVGTLHEVWYGLDVVEQELAAQDLVDGLRAAGLREIMVYDDDGRLRIQALGEGPPRIIAVAAAAPDPAP
jgi:hypothetical protein